MRVRVPGTIRVLMLVLVEHDLQALSKSIGDAAQSLDARHMIAALEARDHGLSHAKPFRNLLLRLAYLGPKLQ